MASPTPAPITCRYPLDTTSSSIHVLPDGRKFGYAEYGAHKGRPIFYCPGWPSSRLEGALLDHEASKVGARIIAVDRPGYGLSSPHKDRTLLSHAQDIGTLADHLKLEKYGVLGISGGGPYALACARSLPADKLRVVSIVCGLGSPDMGYSGMNWFHWLGWAFGGRLFPGLLRWWFSREPGGRLDLSDEERMKRVRLGFERNKARMNAKDRAFFGDTDYMMLYLRQSREVYAQGMDGFSEDFRLLNSDFGFKIEDIRKDLPVQIWHGKLDNFVPAQHGQKVAARIGDNAHLRLTDDTHASISLALQKEYLTELVKVLEE